MGKQWKQWQTLFSWAPKSLGRKAMTNLDSILKSRDITLATNVCLVKAMFLSSSHVWMRVLNYKDSWVVKNWCFWTVVWEKTLESPLDCKENQSVHSKGNQSWIFIGRTDADAETPILWHLMQRTDSFEKSLIWQVEGGRKGWDDWMVSLTHWTWVWVNSGVADGQGKLVCCSPWGHKESDTTKRLNWLNWLWLRKFKVYFKEYLT